MPEAAMNKYRYLPGSQDDVRLPRQIQNVQSVAKACTGERLPQRLFWSSVAASDRRHVPAALQARSFEVAIQRSKA